MAKPGTIRNCAFCDKNKNAIKADEHHFRIFYTNMFINDTIMHFY